MDNTIKQRLSQLTSKCQILAKNAKYIECIDIMQEIVTIKKQVFGITHPQFEKSSQKLCQYLNLSAMIYLQKQKFQTSLDCLKKALLACCNSVHLKSTTYNNLACYYRRTGKIRTALAYLIQALQLELKTEHPKTIADTHLNLCVVLSQLDRHEDALQHVMLSIILLQDELLQTCLPTTLGRGSGGDSPPINDERVSVLAIAYHNLGVQFQFLKRYEQAVKIYKKALQLSKDYQPQNEKLIQNLTRVVSSATQQINDQKKNTLYAKQLKYIKQMSENKKDLYKELSKNNDKWRNMPKFRINASRQRQFKSSLQPMNRTQVNIGCGLELEPRQSRAYAGRRNSKYYKSFAVIQTDDKQPIDLKSQEQNKFKSDGNVKINSNENNT